MVVMLLGGAFGQQRYFGGNRALGRNADERRTAEAQLDRILDGRTLREMFGEIDFCNQPIGIHKPAAVEYTPA